MVHLRLVQSDGEDVVPVFFDDNFVSLLPGESRMIGVRYRAADVGKTTAHYEVSGWNVHRRMCRYAESDNVGVGIPTTAEIVPTNERRLEAVARAADL